MGHTQVEPGSAPDSLTLPEGTNLNINLNPSNGNANERFFTESQLEAARQQEKDKLYPQLNSLKEQNQTFQQQLEALNSDKAARDAETNRLADEAAAATKAAAEEKLSVQELLAAREAEFAAKQQAFEEEMRAGQAVLRKETEFTNLANYISQRVADETANYRIMPELVDMIGGNTKEEIDASITKMQEKTASIIAGKTGGTTPPPANPQTPGVSPTGFAPAGPLDTLSGQRQYTEQEINNMTMAEYAEFRKKSGIASAGNNRGIFN
jgi:hypothetical protein